MAKSLDINALKEHRTTGSPFLEFLGPDGDQFFAYALQAVTDFFQHDNTMYDRVEQHANFKILALQPDGAAIPRMRKKPAEYVEIGQTYRVNCKRHAVLFSELSKHAPINGKTFHIMNRGMVKGKLNDYTDYAVIEATEGLQMKATQLLALKQVFEPKVPDYEEE